MSPCSQSTDWSLDFLNPPWGNLSSIFEHIRSHGTDQLPDESLVRSKSKFGWIAGAWDGALGHHWRGSDPPPRVFEIVSALQKLLERADAKTLTTLYGLLVDEPILPSLELLNQEIAELLPSVDRSRLLQVARFLTLRSAHREALKFGVTLIGFVGSSDDLDTLRIIGSNEEFTLYSAITITQIAPDPEQALWEIAKRVRNWGRIQVVQRLKDTKNADIQRWMLVEGFRNGVMDEYLACICARSGRLDEALKQLPVDDDLLDGAADIIHALIMGGPAEDIDAYAEAVDACHRYLDCALARRDLGLRHFLAIDKLRWFLSQPDGWEERLKSGWTDEHRNTLREKCDEVFQWEIWREKTTKGLTSKKEQAFHEADTAAGCLSIDTWQLHFDRVKADPLTSSSWYRLMQQTDDTRIDSVIQFAQSVLPLTEVETGPGDEMGLGPEFRAHQALDWVLQDLRRFPGKGWRLLKAGLRSPAVRNRNMAIKALAAWPRELWSPEITAFLLNAHEVEPCDDVKRRFGMLLEGRPLS